MHIYVHVLFDPTQTTAIRGIASAMLRKPKCFTTGVLLEKLFHDTHSVKRMKS